MFRPTLAGIAASSFAFAIGPLTPAASAQKSIRGRFQKSSEAKFNCATQGATFDFERESSQLGGSRDAAEMG